MIAAIKNRKTSFLIIFTLSNPIFTSTILATNRAISVFIKLKVMSYSKIRNISKEHLTDVARLLMKVASNTQASRITTNIEFST
jgi:hypothetical protein